jgi:hypothetical protein
MKRIAARIQKAMPDAKITQTSLEGAVTRLIIRQAGVQTKIEVTPVLRGCVYEPQTRAVSEAVESTANDRGTGPATSASPASPANEEERLWAIPLEAPELDDGAAAFENRRELQRRMAALRALPRRERAMAYRAAREWYHQVMAALRERRARTRRPASRMKRTRLQSRDGPPGLV